MTVMDYFEYRLLKTVLLRTRMQLIVKNRAIILNVRWTLLWFGHKRNVEKFAKLHRICIMRKLAKGFNIQFILFLATHVISVLVMKSFKYLEYRFSRVFSSLAYNGVNSRSWRKHPTLKKRNGYVWCTWRNIRITSTSRERKPRRV